MTVLEKIPGAIPRVSIFEVHTPCMQACPGGRMSRAFLVPLVAVFGCGGLGLDPMLSPADLLGDSGLDSGSFGFDSGDTSNSTIDTGDCVDVDGDGFSTCDDDCDDSDINTFPGAAWKEEGALCMTDADGDGWGDGLPAAGVEPGTDCNDDNAALTPADTDGDGYSTCDGDCDDSSQLLRPYDGDGDGYSTCDDDCDDNDINTHPGAAPSDSGSACMTDADGDGWGSLNPNNNVVAGTDCNDSSSSFNPGVSDTPWDNIDQNCDGSDAGSLVSGSTSSSQAINDYQTVNSSLSMGSCSSVYDIEVDLNITHTWRGDLEVILYAPDNSSVRLHNRGGSSADDLVGTYAITGGTLTASQSLSGFVGVTGSGSWNLQITDYASGDTGRLNSWGLTISCP